VLFDRASLAEGSLKCASMRAEEVVRADVTSAFMRRLNGARTAEPVERSRRVAERTAALWAEFESAWQSDPR
jgi:hypothetical protein